MSNARLSRIPAGSVEQLANSMQREITNLREEIRNLQRTPKFTGPLDMQGHRITNVGRTIHQGDVAPRSELIDKAMYDNGSGQHVARSPIIATSGVRAKKMPREPDEMATVRYVKSLIGSAGGSNLVTTDTQQSISGQKLFVGMVNLTPVTMGTLNVGNNHNVALPDGTFFLIANTPSGNFGITGLDDGGVGIRNGRVVVLANYRQFSMTLVDQSQLAAASSTATNRIQTLSNGANIASAKGGTAILIYDGLTLFKWIVVAVNI